MYASTKAITRPSIPSTVCLIRVACRLFPAPARKDCQNLHTACLDVSISSCCKHRAISENPSHVLFSTTIRCYAYNDRRAICVCSYQLRTYVQTCTATKRKQRIHSTFYALRYVYGYASQRFSCVCYFYGYRLSRMPVTTQ